MTLNPKDYLLAGLALAFALSAAGNVMLWNDLEDARVSLGAATESATNAQEAAKLCSQSVDRMIEDGKARKAAAETLIEQAKASERDHGQKAQVIIQTPPSTPGDACKSFEDLGRKWLKERRQ